MQTANVIDFKTRLPVRKKVPNVTSLPMREVYSNKIEHIAENHLLTILMDIREIVYFDGNRSPETLRRIKGGGFVEYFHYPISHETKYSQIELFNSFIGNIFEKHYRNSDGFEMVWLTDNSRDCASIEDAISSWFHGPKPSVGTF